MTNIVIKNLEMNKEIDKESMILIEGGRMKLPFNTGYSRGNILTAPDGSPVDVYVDGVRVNSVSDGYYHYF